MNKKIISFSLWGSNPLYTIGALKNADIALELYPEWQCVYYCNSCVPQEILNLLKNKKNTIIIELNSIGNFQSALNRFLIVDEPEVEYAIFRDTDSRLSKREKIAVDEWLKNDTDIHIMRDHPYHGWFIQAGMFGLKSTKFKGKMKNAIEQYSPKNLKTEDQNFMSAYIRNMIITEGCSVTEHDPFFAKKQFPFECCRGKCNNGVYFVGEQILVDENGNDIYPEISEDIKLVNAHKID